MRLRLEGAWFPPIDVFCEERPSLHTLVVQFICIGKVMKQRVRDDAFPSMSRFQCVDEQACSGIGTQDVELLTRHRECKEPVRRIGVADRDDIGTVVFGASQSRQALAGNRRYAFVVVISRIIIEKSSFDPCANKCHFLPLRLPTH